MAGEYWENDTDEFRRVEFLLFLASKRHVLFWRALFYLSNTHTHTSTTLSTNRLVGRCSGLTATDWVMGRPVGMYALVPSDRRVGFFGLFPLTSTPDPPLLVPTTDASLYAGAALLSDNFIPRSGVNGTPPNTGFEYCAPDRLTAPRLTSKSSFWFKWSEISCIEKSSRAVGVFSKNIWDLNGERPPPGSSIRRTGESNRPTEAVLVGGLLLLTLLPLLMREVVPRVSWFPLVGPEARLGGEWRVEPALGVKISEFGVCTTLPPLSSALWVTPGLLRIARDTGVLIPTAAPSALPLREAAVADVGGERAAEGLPRTSFRPPVKIRAAWRNSSWTARSAWYTEFRAAVGCQREKAFYKQSI